MNEQEFYGAVNEKARETGVNPLLLISGIEGLYTFRHVPASEINFEFLDSLILTIFTLRIGDKFHALATENFASNDYDTMQAAALELKILTPAEIAQSSNPYLQSFATLLNGKTMIRNYHIKALEVAALEIGRVREQYGNSSIGTIVLELCKNDLVGPLNLSEIFGA